MSINRLFGITYYLLNNKKTTTIELANHFEVSSRTICRDINTLSSLGIPVYTKPGRSGGIYLLDSFILSNIFLSKEEQSNLLLLLKGLRQFNPGLNDQSFAKLKALFNNSFDDWLEIDFTTWFQSDTHDDKFTLIKTSIIKKIQIEFDYISKNRQQRRLCCPYKLIFKSQAWYLQAFDLNKKAFRFFKINRISGIKLTAQSFSVMEVPEVSRITLERKTTAIELIFQKEVLYRVYDEFEHKAITVNDDGSVFVKAEVPIEPWLAQYLLSFGKSIKVLSPNWLKQEMKKELMDLYSNLSE